ncbi:MAG TPA: hypothetical protein PKE29_18430 [Phycisphaerales bacterium]|nr:hypothetical protein [Phycisphaerales bacterium]
MLLRSPPPLPRLGLTGLLLTILLGLAASLAHLYFHDHNRDESPDLTTDDIRAAYSGLDKPAPLLTALERNHPDTLRKDQRDTLLTWLRSGRIAEDYDNIDLGPASPSEIIASSCISCHSPRSSDPTAAAIRLDSLESITRLAHTKHVNPAPVNIVAMSTHAHALSLAPLGIVLGALLWFTRLPRPLVSLLIAAIGLGLFIDIACWWVARASDAAIYGILLGGAAFNAGSALATLLILADLWWPRRSARPAP